KRQEAGEGQKGERQDGMESGPFRENGRKRMRIMGGRRRVRHGYLGRLRTSLRLSGETTHLGLEPSWKRAFELMPRGFAGLPEMAAVVGGNDAEGGVRVVVHIGERRLHLLLVDGLSGGSMDQAEQFVVQSLELVQRRFRVGRLPWLRQFRRFQLEQYWRPEAPGEKPAGEVQPVFPLVVGSRGRPSA